MKKILLFLFILSAVTACSKKEVESDKQVVFVSILPQKNFVEKIAGDHFTVEVMVLPGQSPATYEVLPEQMVKLSTARAFFRVGVPFENRWIDKISEANPDMKIVDTRDGITLRTFKSTESHSHDHDDEHEHEGDHDHDDEHEHEDDHDHDDEHKHEDEHDHDHAEKDPHIWMSPSLVKIQSQTMYNTLVSLAPEKKDEFKTNLDAFHAELDTVRSDVTSSLSGVTKRDFMIFHPSFGYFADEFDLTQIAIEIEGKEPGPEALQHIIEKAQKDGVKVIFVQKQFSTKSAEAVAEAIGGSVVQIDPLAEDYISNLKIIGKTLSENL
jgi:zinc transport system substrate-binding protein